ncbi:MAG TPA: NFACT RNA binding domain-containing protein [Bacteroidota bacterium]|nr:NFACT RNA binding domain-containing protein [Bacteroidota bacterium]
MISNYYTFRYIVSTLSPTLPGRRIREAYTQNPDELVVAFEEYPVALVFLCRPDESTLYLTERASRARRNSADLLKKSHGLLVNAVSIDPGDRIIRLELEDTLELVAVLYGPRANVLLSGTDGTVQDAFKRPRALRGGTIAGPGREPQYDFPGFHSACAGARREPLLAVVRRHFPLLGATLAAEAILRSGMDGTGKGADTDAASLDALEASIRSLLDEIATPVPRLYMTDGGRPEYLSLVALRLAAALREERMGDIHTAVRRYLSARGATEQQAHDTEAILTPLRAQIEKTRRALRATEQDAAGSERAAEYERCGNVLLASLASIRKGEREFRTAINGEPVAIALEPSLSALGNAQKYFARAKRARAVLEETSRRREQLRSRIARGEGLVAEAERVIPGGGAREFLEARGAELKEFGFGGTHRAEELPPFRLFTVDGGFEVWAGKNGSNNDLLTLRYARPDDIWFHARGGSGSHVVLRKRSGRGEPGKRALEQAAAIAAYYSKMRTAGTVAVAMTEKRYVRKPRGAPPGTVAIEREKVLFVTPALPRDAGT